MNQATEKKENLKTKYIQTKDQMSLSKMVVGNSAIHWQ